MIHFRLAALHADFENSGCDCLVLSVSGLPLIPLSNLRFSSDGVGADGFCPDAIVLKKEAVLSVTLPFGEVKGIALIHCGESALDPKARNLQYTMSFEKVHCPRLSYKNSLKPNRNRKGNRTEKLTDNFALIHHKSKPLTATVDGFCISRHRECVEFRGVR